MARGNLFVELENEYKNTSKEMIILDAKARIIEVMVCFLEDQDFQSVLNMLFISAVTGINCKNGIIKSEEKELFHILLTDVLGQVLDEEDIDSLCENYYNAIKNGIPSDIYDLLENIAKLGNAIAMPVLRLILAFAYIDNRADDYVMDKLEGVFSANLMADYFENGGSDDDDDVQFARVSFSDNGGINIHSTNRPVTVTLSGLEAEITKWMQREDTLHPKSQIIKRFSRYSKFQIEKALDSLCDKNVLIGGENMINCSYMLANDGNVKISFASSYGSSSSSSRSTSTNHSTKSASKTTSTYDSYEEKRYKDYLSKVETIKSKIEKLNAEGLKKIEAEYKKSLDELKKQEDKEKENYEKKKGKLSKKMEAKQKELSELGFFDFKKKKEIKTEIAKLNEELEKLKASHDRKMSDLLTEQKQLSSKKASDIEAMKAKIEKENPLPMEVKKPESLWSEEERKEKEREKENERIGRLIIQALDEIDNYARISEIQRCCTELSEYSYHRISTVLSKLIEKGKVAKKVENGISVFLSL